LIEFKKKNNSAKPIAKRSPMMGPVLLISNTIATCPEEDVKTVLNDDLEWKKFVTQELKPYNEKISGKNKWRKKRERERERKKKKERKRERERERLMMKIFYF